MTFEGARYFDARAELWPLTHCHTPFLSIQTFVKRDLASKGLSSLSRPVTWKSPTTTAVEPP